MEFVYIKNLTRKWCTDEVDVQEYFQGYSKVLSKLEIARKKNSALNNLRTLLNADLSRSEIDELRAATDPRQFNEIMLDDCTVRVDSSILKRTSRKYKTRKSTPKKFFSFEVTPKPSTSKNISNKCTPMNSKSPEGSSEESSSHEGSSSEKNPKKTSKKPKYVSCKRSLKKKKDMKQMNSCVDLNIVNSGTGRQIKEEPFSRNRLFGSRLPRADVFVMKNESSGYRNIEPNQEYAVHFRIHEPFQYSGISSWRPGRCSHELCALGSQRLIDLKDKIFCENDYQDARGEMSRNPNSAVRILAKDVYRSSMFYIGNTFYVDTREEDMIDYSKVLKKWASEHKIDLGETKQMEKTKISDLKLRFGYPYVFVHQGNCEHLIIISDARLVSAADCRTFEDYPMVVRITHKNIAYCMLCNRHPFKWIVKGSDRMLYDMTYLCDSCLKRYNYINGKKLENFEAYLYTQRGTLF